MESQQDPEVAAAAQSDLTRLLAALEHERTAAMAYSYWLERGCPEGSPEEDWFRAEQTIHSESQSGSTELEAVAVLQREG